MQNIVPSIAWVAGVSTGVVSRGCVGTFFHALLACAFLLGVGMRANAMVST